MTASDGLTARRKIVLDAVRGMIRENPDVRQTFDAICGRGVSHRDAEEEIERAFLGCFWEASRQMPDRWPDVLRLLREGRSAAELFPDSLYDSDGHKQ
jgi:hypothetical protein